MENIEVREIQGQAILCARASLTIREHRNGYTFAMLDGSFSDDKMHSTRTSAETAGIAWIASHRPDIIGSGELI